MVVPTWSSAADSFVVSNAFGPLRVVSQINRSFYNIRLHSLLSPIYRVRSVPVESPIWTATPPKVGFHVQIRFYNINYAVLEV